MGNNFALTIFILIAVNFISQSVGHHGHHHNEEEMHSFGGNTTQIVNQNEPTQNGTGIRSKRNTAGNTPESMFFLQFLTTKINI